MISQLKSLKRNAQSLWNKDVANQLLIENREQVIAQATQELSEIPAMLLAKKAQLSLKLEQDIKALKLQHELDLIEADKNARQKESDLQSLILAAKAELGFYHTEQSGK